MAWTNVPACTRFQGNLANYTPTHQGGAPLVLYNATASSRPMTVFAPLTTPKAGRLQRDSCFALNMCQRRSTCSSLACNDILGISRAFSSLRAVGWRPRDVAACSSVARAHSFGEVVPETEAGDKLVGAGVRHGLQSEPQVFACADT